MKLRAIVKAIERLGVLGQMEQENVYIFFFFKLSNQLHTLKNVFIVFSTMSCFRENYLENYVWNGGGTAGEGLIIYLTQLNSIKLYEHQ